VFLADKNAIEARYKAAHQGEDQASGRDTQGPASWSPGLDAAGATLIQDAVKRTQDAQEAARAAREQARDERARAEKRDRETPLAHKAEPNAARDDDLKTDKPDALGARTEVSGRKDDRFAPPGSDRKPRPFGGDDAPAMPAHRSEPASAGGSGRVDYQTRSANAAYQRTAVATPQASDGRRFDARV
jgi:hypothetical protein